MATFELFGGKRLEVFLKDINAFATTIRSCAFSSLKFAGPWMFQLCSVLAERGVRWDSYNIADGRTKLAFPTSVAGDYPGCFCGACMVCLRATGIVEACSEVPLEEEASI